MKNSKLIARWNDDGAFYVSMKHPLHGANMDLKLKPRTPIVIDRVWLECAAFQSKSVLVDGEDSEFEERTISYWYSDDFPRVVEIDTSPMQSGEGITDMTTDMAESLRQVILGKWTPEKASLLQMVPGARRNITVSWAINSYMPWLKRVVDVEKRFQNRQNVIELCEASISKIRELM